MPAPVKRTITIRLPVALINAVKHHAIETNQDLQDIVEAALLRYLVKRAK